MERVRDIVDTHIHLASSAFPNDWVDHDLNSDAKSMHSNMALKVDRHKGDLSLESLVEEIKETCSSTVKVERMVFVECGNDGGSTEEAKWALSLAADPTSQVCAVVAHIPVPDGEEAVRIFLSSVASWVSSSSPSMSEILPTALRGGRVVLLGNPMPPSDACLSDKYIAGLAVLEEYGLHWEWCCHSSSLFSIATACSKFPNMTFVLNHCGRNGGTEDDVDEWKAAIACVAKQQNVVCKIGAIEEWGVANPHPLLDFVVECFGFQRVMFESNWFVSKACGFRYDRLVRTAEEAMKRNGATEEDLMDVFCRNAERVYKL